MKRTIFPASLALALVFASCQPRLVLMVSPEAAELIPVAREALAGLRRPVDIIPEPVAWPSGAVVLRLTSTPGTNLPFGAPPLVALPRDKELVGSISLPLSLQELGSSPGQSLQVLPILFDVWGRTSFSDGKSMTPFTWKTLVEKGRANSLAVAGSRPSFRQAVFALGRNGLPAPEGALDWFSAKAEGGDLGLMSPLVQYRAWAPGVWSWTASDLGISYRPGTKWIFLETYRDFERGRASGNRQFVALLGDRPKGFALAGTVLFLEYRADRERSAYLLPLVRIMASPAFEKEAGMRTKWLAANLRAPEIDGEGAAVRNLAVQALAFFAVSDSLPLAQDNQTLLSDIQTVVDRIPRR
jgi:hypothetical protein